MKTIIEPFKIKSVEPIHINSKSDRSKLIENADYNLFQLLAYSSFFGLFSLFKKIEVTK